MHSRGDNWVVVFFSDEKDDVDAEDVGEEDTSFCKLCAMSFDSSEVSITNAYYMYIQTLEQHLQKFYIKKCKILNFF